MLQATSRTKEGNLIKDIVLGFGLWLIQFCHFPQNSFASLESSLSMIWVKGNFTRLQVLMTSPGTLSSSFCWFESDFLLEILLVCDWFPSHGSCSCSFFAFLQRLLAIIYINIHRQLRKKPGSLFLAFLEPWNRHQTSLCWVCSATYKLPPNFGLTNPYKFFLLIFFLNFCFLLFYFIWGGDQRPMNLP